MYDGKLLGIVKAFKTWRHYLEDSQHEVFMLINYNNLCRFMDTKSLSSKKVHWAQKLSRYHFQIDYCQSKAHRAIDALDQYPQQDAEEEKTLRAKSVKILHCLQYLLTNASILGLMFSEPNLLFLYQVFVCRIYVLS